MSARPLTEAPPSTRFKRFCFAERRTSERPDLYLLRVGHWPLPLDSLTDAALADLCDRMCRDFRLAEKLKRLNREKEERQVLIQEPASAPWWVKAIVTGAPVLQAAE